VTATLTDDQRLKVLAKAFPLGRYQAWYRKTLESFPWSGVNATWSRMKAEIIKRYAETESRDRHFIRLRELKFVNDGRNKLYDFVEDVLYSFAKAYPEVKDDGAKIRFVKSVIPGELKATLSLIPECDQPETVEKFLEGARKFDSMGSGATKGDESVKPSELAALLKELVTELRQTKSVVAAMRPRSPSPYGPRRTHSDQFNESRDPSPGPSARPRYQAEEYSKLGPVRRERSPSSKSRSYQHGASSDRPKYASHRNSSTETQRWPAKSESRNSRANNSNSRKERRMDRRPKGPDKERVPPSVASLAVENEGKAFDQEKYFRRFQVPPRPCHHCGLMHWARHCPDNLN